MADDKLAEAAWEKHMESGWIGRAAGGPTPHEAFLAGWESALKEAALTIEKLEKLVEAYRERDDAEAEATSLRMHDVGTKRWDAAMDAVVDAEKALAAHRRN